MDLIKDDEEKIFVSVRLRPLNRKEISSNDVSDWDCSNNDTIVYKNATSESLMYPTQYTFDRVFGSDCSTSTVYEQGAKKVANSVVHGVNSTVFAYGQTNSGKTYTMTGITEHAVTDIYDYIEKHPEREFVLKFSAMEIYKESVRDMLSVDNTPLRLIDDPKRGTIVENLTEEILMDRDHVTELLFICEAQRQTEETPFNDMSSLSHQIIRLTVESLPRGVLGPIHAASLNLVDLAGSEQSDKSLLTFGSVIHKLRNNKDVKGNIPYRDSKLTRILQPWLRGNARTAIVCTMSPARSHVKQSRNTLHFASCINASRVDVGKSDNKLVKHLQEEITRLENELKTTLQASITSLNYSALLKEKDAQIQKLEKEVKDLILQRDIPKLHVKELSRMLGEDAHVGSKHYPHLRVHISPERYTQELENRALSIPQLIDLSRSNSRHHNAKIPFFDDNSDQHNAASPTLLLPSNSSFSETDSFYGLQEFEKQIRGNLEDLCRDVGRLETEQSRNRGTSEDKDRGFPAINVDDDNEEHVNVSSGKGQELTSASVDQGTQETHDSFGNSPHFKVARSTSSDAEGVFVADSPSPWFKMTPYNGSGKESDMSTLNFGSGVETLPGAENFSTAEDCTPDTREEDAHKLAKFPMKNVTFDETDLKEDEIRLTSWPVEFRKLRREMIELWHSCNISLVHRSYFFLLFQGDPSDAIYLEVEIRRTKVLKDKFTRGDKIIVDGRRLTLSSRFRFLHSFKGHLVHNSSTSINAKALRQERRTLSEQMMKKMTEEERQKLFMEWGIGLNTKLRRLQLTHLIWSKTDDINHITESAFLVAKLAGFMDPQQTPSRDMFGVSFTPKSSAGMGTFKRSLGLGSLM